MTRQADPIPFKNVLVLGGTGGIGNAFIEYLVKLSPKLSIDATYHSRSPRFAHPRVKWHRVDAAIESEIELLCSRLEKVDICINAIGFLHNAEFNPEKATRQIDPDYFMESMRTNAMPTLLLAKHIEPLVKQSAKGIFLTVSARVGSIEENQFGGWYSYRASKAALNMVLKTLAIEWRRTLPNVIVVALHPGTTDTELSRPFQKRLPQGQLQQPGQSVEMMMNVIGDLQADDSGKFLSFDGQMLPW